MLAKAGGNRSRRRSKKLLLVTVHVTYDTRPCRLNACGHKRFGITWERRVHGYAAPAQALPGRAWGLPVTRARPTTMGVWRIATRPQAGRNAWEKGRGMNFQITEEHVRLQQRCRQLAEDFATRAALHDRFIGDSEAEVYQFGSVGA